MGQGQSVLDEKNIIKFLKAGKIVISQKHISQIQNLQQWKKKAQRNRQNSKFQSKQETQSLITKLFEVQSLLEVFQNNSGGKKAGNKIEELREKYLSKTKKIAIGEEFEEQFSTFSKDQQEQIKARVIEQFKGQAEEIIRRLKKDSEQKLTEEKAKLNRRLYTLTAKLKNEVSDVITKMFKEEKQEREKLIDSANKRFRFEQANQLLSENTNPQVQQTYKRKLQEFFYIKKENLRQQITIQKFSNILFELFIENSNGNQIEGKSQYQKISSIFLDKFIDIINQKIGQKIRSLEIIFSFRYQKVKLNQDEQLFNIEKQLKQLQYIWEFLTKHKKVFSKYEQFKNQHVKTLMNVSNNIFHKNLRKTSEINDKKVKEEPDLLVQWKLYKEIYLLICDTLEKQLTIYSEDNPNKEQFFSNRKILNEKWLQISNSPQKLIDQLENLNFYSYTMQKKSQDERERVFQEIQQKFQILNGYEKTKLFKNLSQSIDKAKNKKITQIQEGIQISCKEIQKGFNSVDCQFAMKINLSISIMRLVDKKMPYLQIKDEYRRKIQKKIGKLWKQHSENMVKSLVAIEDFIKIKKNEREQKIIMSPRQSFISTSQNLEQYQLEQKRKLQEYTKNERKKLRLDLLYTSSEQKKQQRRKVCQINIQQKERQMRQNIEKLKNQKKQKQKKQQNQYNKKMSNLIKDYCQPLLKLFKFNKQINYNQEQLEIELSKKLKSDKKRLGQRIFNLIYDHLKKQNNKYAFFLTSSQETFKANEAKNWHAKFKGNSIGEVLSEIAITQDKKSQLRNLYESYQAQFNRFTSQYKKSLIRHDYIKSMITKIKQEAKILAEYYNSKTNFSQFSPQKLLAGIFALRTIINSDIKQDDDLDQDQFCYQPHTAQVVSIFLCLSFLKSEEPKMLNSKMAQIGTGEGKSVVLGGISAYLALCGFEVSTVCYSAYLSQRDRNQFKQLFNQLQIQDKITYGTFENVCQSLLNNKKDSSEGFRGLVKKILEEKIQSNESFFLSPWKKLQRFFKQINPFKNLGNQNKKILLIDEVDVFFDPSFFGSIYSPDVCLSSNEISELIKKVWKQYKNNNKITENELISSKQYKEVLKKYQNLKDILLNQLRGMILGCMASDHDYVVKEDLIQYKDQDGLSSKISYGFRTLFAYMKEHDRSQITTHSRDQALKISLIVAELSYAMLPMYFKSIIGVTGTYENMSEHKKDYMKNTYKVKQYFIMPSVYGKQSRRTINPPKILKQENHWQEIIKEIKEIHEKDRPVLVFFENMAELNSFYISKNFQQFQSKTNFLNQAHTDSDRKNRIKKTCDRKRITLMTKSFGRGTDFVAFDQTIYQIGGLHVIQTFLSVEQSQQFQIQSRTARQGNPGSYSLIIKEQDLQKLDLEISCKNNLNQQIKNGRKRIQQRRWAQLIKNLKNTQQKHKKCIQIYEGQNKNEIRNFITSLNTYQQVRSQTCKTIIMIDGTRSMSHLIKKLLSILDEVVKDVIEITGKQKNVSVSELQICVYRNYNCPYQTVFQSTPFETSANNLIKFLKSIDAEGGLGRQAIELGYWHVNKIENVDQVIIIGDAPANQSEETKQKRKQKGQDYWDRENIPLLSSQEQLQKIIKKKVPIHSFYIQNHSEAKKYFQQVSKKTSGKAQQFHIDAPNSSKKLSQFIAQNILQKATKDEKQGQKMVEQYRKRHSL